MSEPTPPTTPAVEPSKVYTEQEFAQTQAQMRAAREEAKGHRLAATNAETAKTAAEAALAAATAAHTDVLSKADAKFVKAELKSAAIAAGINDASDALAMIDLTKITRDAEGNPTNAAELLTELKAAKPYLFGTTIPATGNTSTGAPAPKPAPTAAKKATEMTDAEYAALKATLTGR